MLIFERAVGQSFHIGDDVVVKVLGINAHGQIRIGVDAPKDVPVHREEVYRRILLERVHKAEGLAAPTSAPATAAA